MDLLVFAVAVILFIGSLAGSICGNMLASELYDRAPPLAERLIERSISRLPCHLRARYREEWFAHLNDCSGKLGKLVHAIGCFCGTRAITADSKGTDLSTTPVEENFDPIEEKFEKIRELNDKLRANPAMATLFISDGVFKIGLAGLERILEAIAGQQDFEEDLVGLHDFGTVTVDGHRFRWSIETPSEDDDPVAADDPTGGRYFLIQLDKDSKHRVFDMG